MKTTKIPAPFCYPLRSMILPVFLICGTIALAGNNSKELDVYRGSTPMLDGKISSGEYEDATYFTGTGNWTREFRANSDNHDLSLKAWVKHDGMNLYFAFDVTDDVIYGIDIPRWLPDINPLVHEFTPDHGWPWFGDGIEIYMNPQNQWDTTKNEEAWGDGLCWKVVCSTHKSFQDKLAKGGLIDGEPKNDAVWKTYRDWITSGAMKAVVRIKPEGEGKGYIMEWQIAANPCLEVNRGVFWEPSMGTVKMGFDIECQDLDEKEKGDGNFANMRHVDLWASRKGEKGAIKNWGTLIMNPGFKPESSVVGSNLTDQVNVFIGSSNDANTHPGPVLPWGMISLSPLNSYDTISHSSGASPYYFSRPYISGFTHLNMSGTGCPDMGTFCLMPTTGNLTLHQPDNTSTYSEEKAVPGFYSVMLNRFNVQTELTTTLRTGLSRFTFPKGKSNILLNLGVGLTTQKGGSLKRISDTEVEGFKSIGNFCGIKGLQTVYFVARISKKPVESGVWTDGKTYPDFNREIAGNDIGAYFSFDTEENESICVKVGVSYVSIANARKNLEAEQPGFDFEGTREAAEQEWNNELSKIQVEGSTADDKVKFYTALYHLLIHPSLASDVSGKEQKANSAIQAETQNRYTIFSLWDTYRNVHPFLSLVYPKQQSDMVKSMLGIYQEHGWLSKWELAGMETNCMVGDPAIPVIVDSYLRGVNDFDVNLAWEAMKHNASMSLKQNPSRPGLDDWLNHGYIPDDAPYTLKVYTSANIANEYENARRLGIVWGSVSTGMEYCIADWNLAQMANALGKTDDYQMFLNRSLNYRNNFDIETGFVRPRQKDGSWLSPFDPASKRLNGFVEGSSWTYSFMVPHDMPGLIKLMGGTKKFTEKLNTCFEKDYFDVTNEPDLAYPYLYNQVKGEEWRTQERVREIVNRDFNVTPAGLPGNDDCGTMSAWLVYSMMGFYPDCPGNMNYQLTSPVFSKITISLDPAYYPGKSFVIEAKNTNPGNHYIRSMELNGKPYKKFTINHQDIVKGGSLKFVLKNTD